MKVLKAALLTFLFSELSQHAAGKNLRSSSEINSIAVSDTIDRTLIIGRAEIPSSDDAEPSEGDSLEPPSESEDDPIVPAHLLNSTSTSTSTSTHSHSYTGTASSSPSSTPVV